MTEPQNGDVASQMLHSLAEAQIELDALRLELEESHRLVLVGMMAAGLAHEINNLLTPVLAHAQLAAGRPGDLELQAKTLKTVMRGVKDAAALTRTILGLAGNQPVQSQGQDHAAVDIRDVVESALHCLVRQPEKDGIELTNRIRPKLRVQMEPILLQQVVLNLILNAQRAMARRGGRIELSAREIDPDQVEIEVSDTGPGIPESMIDRLFEPLARRRAGRARLRDGEGAFQTGKTGVGATSGESRDRNININLSGSADQNDKYDGDLSGSPDAAAGAVKRVESQAPSTLSNTERGRALIDPADDPGGSGLGLATCRLLLEHAGGLIAVRSAPGQGSTFTITLPRAAEHPQRAAG